LRFDRTCWVAKTEIDPAWIDLALRSARPRALGALLRYFGDLDSAEEAFQEACLVALQKWPENGPPRDVAAWLILVGRNAGIDGARRRKKEKPLPPDEVLSDLDDAEGALAQRLDDAHYRDDVLRLLFVCCHPELPATQQIALALRVVSGLTVRRSRARSSSARRPLSSGSHAPRRGSPPRSSRSRPLTPTSRPRASRSSRR
jgi:predicted RNA polymerase sigma factor